MSFLNIREEELKNKIAQTYFKPFDCTKIIGNIDFCVTLPQNQANNDPLFETQSLFWAEAKKGKSDIYHSIVQLILTIGKARTFDKQLPPAFLGAFDAEQIAFIPYNDIQEIFYQNDFNWNVTPSNYDTKEFKYVLQKVKHILDNHSLRFHYQQDEKHLNLFIKQNFIEGKQLLSKIKIDKNNFLAIYNKWLTAVRPSISVRWDIAKKNGIIDGDFYLADLLSQENETLKEKLYVLLKKDHYELDRTLDEMGMFNAKKTAFNDQQKAHTQFWNKYERPPKQEYWDYIVARRDLLVPQDVRERKGSFFTPQIWVELSQKYLTDVLGEDWQDDYYIWDCAAGTGNLLTGLTNKYHIWASTLDKQDVDVMRDRIKNGANLLENHVFQFDFLNDDFTKLPKSLQNIINDPQKRKKLVIYINPPYAEHTNKSNINETSFKENLNKNSIHNKYASFLKKANLELSAQFMARIYYEIPNVLIAEFSKLKMLQSPNFGDFRTIFLAKLEKCFIVPANTFDNVKGQFPIGFKIWNTFQKESFSFIITNVYDEKGKPLASKTIYAYNDSLYINDWLKVLRNNINPNIVGFLHYRGNDFQHQSMVFIENSGKSSMTQLKIHKDNLIFSCIYFAVRHCIAADWLNDRDQFLYPNEGWEMDTEFQNDCLAYTLFNNNIQSKYGVNHWIPFSEQAVNAREKFESNFMFKFLSGKLQARETSDLFGNASGAPRQALAFSAEASALFEAGRALWSYYHAQENCNVNAALYDIREHFQKRNDKGKMNNKSEDTQYMTLIGTLRDALKTLARKIAPKVYEYGFLR